MDPPVLAVGIWAFVALVIGVIYPAVLQALKVNPAQSTLEKPYIQRNITATRAAYGLDHVKQVPFQGSTSISASAVAANITTLDNVRLWIPTPASPCRPSRSCKTPGRTTRSSP